MTMKIRYLVVCIDCDLPCLVVKFHSIAFLILKIFQRIDIAFVGYEKYAEKYYR